MIHVFALGAVGGLLCGVARHVWFPSIGGGSSSDAQQPGGGRAGNGGSSRLAARALKTLQCIGDSRAALAGTCVACACAAGATLLVARHRRRSGKRGGGKAHRQPKDGRIPLQDLIRFKERTWFVEELENARDADPNAMLRLAKMYLHGQGCQRNIAMAQEWVRKARNMGVPATLDELFATDDPDPRGRLRALAAAEERRRALRKAAPAGAYRATQQQQQHTAAA